MGISCIVKKDLQNFLFYVMCMCVCVCVSFIKVYTDNDQLLGNFHAASFLVHVS
jgi:hypothetical protein